MEVVFPSDYSEVIGAKKALFLEECKEFVSKKGTVDASCLDVRPAPIIVALNGSDKAVTAAAQDMIMGGLKLRRFVFLTGGDLNECASDNTNDCAAEASCTNTNGSYTCECTKGFTGDGFKCTGMCWL